jgi:hypothetical protein
VSPEVDHSAARRRSTEQPSPSSPSRRAALRTEPPGMTIVRTLSWPAHALSVRRVGLTECIADRQAALGHRFAGVRQPTKVAILGIQEGVD